MLIVVQKRVSNAMLHVSVIPSFPNMLSLSFSVHALRSCGPSSPTSVVFRKGLGELDQRTEIDVSTHSSAPLDNVALDRSQGWVACE